MKIKFYEFFYALINQFIKIINFNKPKIFIYTDSRGYNVAATSGKNPFQSYIKYLIKNYNATYFICPEKHTTISDFLIKTESFDLKKFDFVIMHCGVVDFSPRPLSNLKFVLNSKKDNKYFKIAVEKYSGYYENPYDILYSGEKTQNIYSPEFLEDIIIPELKKIKNLIWINSNNFVFGWEGNYTKGRPENINAMVNAFDNIMQKNLSNIVDLKTWNDEDIKKFTIDNIHFNNLGFKEVFTLINKKLKNVK